MIPVPRLWLFLGFWLKHPVQTVTVMAHQNPMGDAPDSEGPHSWTSSFPGTTLILLQAKHLQ